MSYATCHTDECANNGITIDVGNLTWTDEETGEEHTSSVSCGVCGQPIEDITEQAPGQAPGQAPIPD